ncbi:hypothetical protein KJ819_02205 [Patescibacteria group bacterium]|nr:hypothetical protein [Patescibacteria group bacterium]MBU1500903.1 hypothetical protein [Patescibacteria group bacterium]MBU2080958.1 hypothetical protein [Patescibacteria group bacterium]MBU2124063.1 hypothetical protein [Patescibacteria group bacterium]MBU2194646.1 hypothetical protein [Patescibacteria group bacterium]
METPSKTSPRDFFLWAGAVIALYGSVISFITLLFEYVNRAFPDPLAYYGDPYGGSVRAAMAAVIVLVPTTLILFRLIRGSIAKEPGKANIWVRRWALVLTIFIATVTILIDLITLLTTFLGGEISIRFALKVAIVLLVAGGIFLHFIADFKGYWLKEIKKAHLVGIAVAVLTFAAVFAGFFIIGTPQDARMMRYDQQKVSDLQTIQYQITTYYQQKEELPNSLQQLNDPLSGFSVPVDPQSGGEYAYEQTSDLSFTLCATFNRETQDTKGTGAYPTRDSVYGGIDENWTHGIGEVCFARTIDPDKYPPFDLKVR